jgi:hypothetical protein
LFKRTSKVDDIRHTVRKRIHYGAVFVNQLGNPCRRDDFTQLFHFRSKQLPGVLRERVTSKGGTTAAALAVFEEARLAEHFRRAIEAASRRGAELGDELGRD